LAYVHDGGGWGGGEEEQEGGEYLEYDLMPSPAGCLPSGSGASLSGLSGRGGEVGRVGGGSVGGGGRGGGSGLFARVAVEGGVEKAGRGRGAGRGGGAKRLQEWPVRPKAVDRCRLTPFILNRR